MFDSLKDFKTVKHQYKQNQAFAFFRVTHPRLRRKARAIELVRIAEPQQQ